MKIISLIMFLASANLADEFLISVIDLPRHYREELHVTHVLYNNYLVLAQENDLEVLTNAGVHFTCLDTNPRLKAGQYYIVYPTEFSDTAVRGIVDVRGDFPLFLVVRVEMEKQRHFFSLQIEKELLTYDRYTFKNSVMKKTSLSGHRFLSTISDVVNQVSIDSLRSMVGVLQGFKSRHTSKNSDDVVPWLIDKYKKNGCDSVFIIDVKDYGPNVIGVIKGTRPETGSYCLLGAHFDAVLLDDSIAAGADDNASGTAALLETARVLSKLQFEHTIRLASFNGEELGLLGSKAYVDTLKKMEDSIIGGLINYDMIGYAKESPCLHIHYDSTRSNCREFGNYFKMTAEKYVTFDIKIVMNSDVLHASDHESFLRYGYTAIMGTESPNRKGICPNYHRPGDLLDDTGGLNSSELMANSARAAVAVLADLAIPVTTSALPYSSNFPGCEITSFTHDGAGTISVKLTIENNYTPVTINLYALNGKCIATATNRTFSSGTHHVLYQIKQRLSGLCIVDVRYGSYRQTRQMIDLQ